MVKGSVAGQYRLLLWGVGFLQLLIGVLLLLLPDLVLLDAMDLAYPYLNNTIIMIILILGWIDVITGILSIISGLWAGTLSKFNLESPVEDKIPEDIRILRVILFIISIIIMSGFPIGTFIGITLLREALMLNKERRLKSNKKISDKIEKDALALQYRYLIWGGALHLIIIGLGLLLIVSFAIGEPIELLYEAVQDLLGIGISMLMQLMQIVGFIILIPGIFLFISGFLLNKLILLETETPKEEQSKSLIGLKFIKIIVFVSSIFLLIVIPLGTCIGITLIRESWMLKE